MSRVKAIARLACACFLIEACSGAGLDGDHSEGDTISADGTADDLGPQFDVADTDSEVSDAVEDVADIDTALNTDGFDGPGFSYLVVEPVELDFGIRPLGDTQTRELEIENAGNRPLNVTHLAFIGADGATSTPSDVFATNRSAFTLAPGATTIVMVTFYALAAFPYEDRLRFESDSATGPIDVRLSGGGIALECVDLDGDGYGPYCEDGEDCDQSQPTVHDGAAEPCNGRDDDCDGLTDEDWIGLGTPCESGIGACVIAGQRICNPTGTGLTCAANPLTGGSELCNQLDDDCDGATDEDFPELGSLCTVGTGVCRESAKWVCAIGGLAVKCDSDPQPPPGPEVIGDGLDNDCDGRTDEEPDLEVGCSDGGREGFIDIATWPDIAACSGAWSIGGVVTDALTPTCDRLAGDDGNPPAAGCNVSDLCAEGWHVCNSAADVAAHSSTGCQGAAPEPNLFFAIRQSGTGCAQCATGDIVGGECNSPFSCIGGCAPNVFLSNDVFGCGSLGSPPAASCAPLDRFSHNNCSALLPPWACSGGTVEASNIAKAQSDKGGVVCCRDTP